MYSLIELLMRKPRGPTLAIFVSIVWIVVAAIGYVAGSMLVFTQSLLLGGILLVLSVLLKRFLSTGADSQGGGN